MSKATLTTGPVLALLLAAGAAHAQTAPDCDRACLKGFTDQYFEALAANDPSKLTVAAKVKFTENSKLMKLGEGLWKTADATSYRLELFDPQSGNAAVQAVVKEGDKAAIVLVRIKVEQRKIAEVETLVVRKEDSPLFGPQNLAEPQQSFLLSLRPAEQDSRLGLMAAADAYWRAFETNGTPEYHPAPFLPGVNRSENGVRTTNVSVTPGRKPRTAAEQFDTGGFPGRRIYDRRYPVVDTENGVVLSIARFGRRPDAPPQTQPGAADQAPLVAEIFAVKKGFIQDIQVVMLGIPKDQATNWPVE